MSEVSRERLTAEARRSRILDAATEVFGRVGFEATRMEDVAKAAGIAKGLLYKHFRSKDAMFEALVEMAGQAFSAQLRTALTDADVVGRPRDALRAGLSLWLRNLGDEKGQGAFSFSDPGVHDAYDGLRDALRAVIAEAMLAAEPRLEVDWARLGAALVQGAAENLGLVWRACPGDITQDDALDLLVEFCWGGIQRLRAALPAVP